MPDVCLIVAWVVLQALLVTAVWLSAVLILRSLNFQPNGKRRTELRGATEDIRARQIEYNNNATYRAFEFFLKITLAILGGAAALAVQQASVPSQPSPTVRVLIVSGSWLLLLAGIVFSFVIFAHQKSKIERWPMRYKWYQPLLWSELWFIQGMLLTAVGMLIWVVPRLVRTG